jgi:hypothetical protein
MSRKKLRLDRRPRFVLEIQPTVVSLLWRSLLSILVSFSLLVTDALGFEVRQANGCF